MATRKSTWLGTLAIVSSLFVSGIASAQDFPTYKGGNNRAGLNSNPNGSGPGRTYLRWWTPSSADNRFTTSLVADNTYNLLANPTGYYQELSGTWNTAPSSVSVNPLNQDASSPYLVPDPANKANEATPAYKWSFCTGSTSTTDPTVGATAAAQWKFTPSTLTPGLYALYVWIPGGPQNEQGQTNPMFPQQYYVYQVNAGGRTYTEVVDTYYTGFGVWARIRNNGTSLLYKNASDNMVFPWDGTDPITITLLNTVPRDTNGNLTMKAPVNRFIVYADAAMAIPTNGYYNASPVSAQLTSGVQASTRTVAALNQFSSGGISSLSNLNTITTGVVTSYVFNTGQPVWNYSPIQTGVNTINTDNSTASETGGVLHDAAAVRYSGNYVSEITSMVQEPAAPSDSITYSPTLNTGTYQIFAYLPGDNSSLAEYYGHSVHYQIAEGAVVSDVYVDQSVVGGGWVQIGSRRYTNIAATPTQSAKSLTVRVTNGTTLLADTTRRVYANALRFVAEADQSISSTPVIANVHLAGTTAGSRTQVVIVADETGRIHCLDSTGNADGTTTEYWSYPSTIASTGTDPNNVGGKDQNAEMPSGFELSSALVQQIGSSSSDTFYLYIAAQNGRVYCIDMAGNNDYGATGLAGPQKTPIGTTNRIWTFPSTAPSGGAIPNSKLGQFRGSITYGNPNGSDPTIYVPTVQGRMYALDAVGNSIDRSTTVTWAFPKVNQAALGEIWTTPAFYTDSLTTKSYLYFGTLQPADDSVGLFYCLDATGYSKANGSTNAVWRFTGDLNTSPGAYVSGPAVVPKSVIYNDVTQKGAFVYAVNQNNYVYAFDAEASSAQGEPTVMFETNELHVGARGAITYTQQSVYNNVGAQVPLPVILVPTNDGRFDSLFAEPNTTNQFGTSNPFNGSRRAFEFITVSPNVYSTLAVSNNWMYGTDESGFLYAFNDDNSGTLSQGNMPGEQTIVENNPVGNIFRHAQMKLVNQLGYNKLRQPTGSNLTYFQAQDPAYSFNRTPMAFEWGETVYVMVYEFPFKTNGNTVAPPTVNVTFSSQGKTIRTIAAEARLFTEPPNAPDDKGDINYPNGSDRDNGYAILSFTFQGGQSQSLPPGPGSIGISISTASLSGNGIQQNVALNPALSNFPFSMANPIAISMFGPDSGGVFQDLYSMGLSPSPSNPENLVNGDPKLSGTTKLENLLAASTNIAQHGTSQTVPVFVIDRSMMALQRPDNTGLDGVRVDMRNLAWQGGHLAIYKPLTLPYYANFEDYPDNFPNDSYDYPDILSEQVQVVKDPNGTAENPRFNTVSLIPPLVKDVGTGQIRPMQMGDAPESRIFQGTRMDMTVNVPRFQPANTHDQVQAAGALVSNSAGSTAINQGYLARVRVFVDSNGNGLLDGASSEPYRSFNLMTSVDVDEKLAVTTPTVDLGTLPQGAGYDPLMPGSNYDPSTSASLGNGVFQPWAGNYKNIFQPFTVQNLGNVNLLNLRVAKGSQFLANGTPTGTASPWGFYSNSNDLLGFLDGSVDLWSSMDQVFAPEGGGPSRPVALQKARITDVAPTQLSVNNVRRANPNLGTTGTISGGYPDVLNPYVVAGGLKYPPGPPTIGVSVPLGMPVGSYTNMVRVIEKYTGGEIWQIANGAPEPFSDPAFNLTFKVREAQMTGTSTLYSATMVDDALTFPQATAGTPYAYSNKQPTMLRDPFGSLVVAWASDRPSWTTTTSPTAAQLGSFSLFFATVKNVATYSSGGISNQIDPQSALSDLNSFRPVTNSQWFKQAIANYPAVAPDLLFGSQLGESVIAGTVQYGNPSFPQSGMKNPFNLSQTFQSLLMGFTGEAQKQTPSGRVSESKLFLTGVTLAGGGTISVSPQPAVLANDPQVAKGKPSVVQTTKGAMVLYPGSSGSQSNIYYSDYGTLGGGGTSFSPSIALPFGPGFQWVSSPSASARVYNGVGESRPGSSGPVSILGSGDNLLELTFVGQLQGRANPEAFYGRMKVDRNALVVVDDNGVAATNPASDGNLFLDLAPVTDELLTSTGQPGLFRGAGVLWDRSASIQVSQVLHGVTTNLLIGGTATFDQQTGMISYDTSLGGKVYIDTTVGTIRFASSVPNQNAMLYASYTPRFLRISGGSGGQGYAHTTGLYDAREISNTRFWRRANGNQADFSDDIRNNRLVFTYNRAANTKSDPPRPFMSARRLGIDLHARIATNSNGDPINVQVSGAIGPYQIDPANGRIYVTDVDEDNLIQVTFLSLLETGNTLPWKAPAKQVTLLPEIPEQQILIDNAVNESDLTSFLDPFSFINQRRPPLIWLFWTSARSGVPDIFFETIAPQWSPISP